jgi:phenylacetate-coenzyme A ligase PaaK-like adenylate-forming protein
MTIAGTIRKSTMSGAIADRAAEYEAPISVEQAGDTQLELLNREWARIVRRVPYYANLVAFGRAPREFRSMEQFFEQAPVTTRASLRERWAERRDGARKPDGYRITGGSTAEPVQLPAWREEYVRTRADMWLARSWYSIDPGSRLFLLWGHAHTLGKGLRGLIQRYRRTARDALLGYARFSAYDLRQDAMRRAVADMLRFRPDYVLGYSVALDCLARANESCSAELGALGIKAVIAAGESFPTSGSARRLERLFGAPVAMEYGAVETDLVAHMYPGCGYRVFWKSYIVETTTQAASGRAAVRVTSLYPRCFPLVRYELGDEIEVGGPLSPKAGLLGFDRVVGRCNQYVTLLDGTVVHSEAFSHAVRAHREIKAFQVVIGERDALQLMLVADGWTNAVERAIRTRLSCVHALLGAIPIHVVSTLGQTRAGKTPMIVRESALTGA